jgi:hypothetical protein
VECRKVQTLKECNCTYPCERRGLCCECVAYHRGSGELPACYFDAAHERTYDRSVAAYRRQEQGR